MAGNYEMGKSVTRSENLNWNRRWSPFEDFMKRTMSILQGVWSKLNYIRELRSADGKYEHWGLAATHGEEGTNRMIADVHSELYLQVLRTPLPELFEQLELSAEDAGCSPQELAEQLYKQRQRITPADLRGGAPEHLRAVLLIHDLLSKSSQGQGSGSPPTKADETI
jgi:hypothetical protein